VTGLPVHRDLVHWTHTFYLQRQTDSPATDADAPPAFGCFSYALWPGDRIRIHFWNCEADDHSPIGRERTPRRLAELAAMFRHLVSAVPSTATVVGGSWLYNLEAYRRLFPPRFLATSRIGENEYRFLALWGQFLDRHGHVRAASARTFLEGLGQHLTEESLQHCFLYRVLRLESSVLPFYEFYGIV
jgi:hypothetical protein